MLAFLSKFYTQWFLVRKGWKKKKKSLLYVFRLWLKTYIKCCTNNSLVSCGKTIFFLPCLDWLCAFDVKICFQKALVALVLVKLSPMKKSSAKKSPRKKSPQFNLATLCNLVIWKYCSLTINSFLHWIISF